MSVTNISASENWVAAWYAPPLGMISADLAGRTLRQVIRLHAGGSQIRLGFSNRYGQNPVTISGISVGKILSGPMVQPGAKPVLFQGTNELILESGQEYQSDPLDFPVEAFQDIALTFYVKAGELQTGHNYGSQTSFVTKIGDFSNMPGEFAMFIYPLVTTARWLISGIEVLPAEPIKAVVAFGSSVTDGVGSTIDADQSWPGFLAKRLDEAGGDRRMSVVNSGVGGNQLTNDNISDFKAFGIPDFTFGEAGLKRLDWDVLKIAGASDLIVHIASNDLRTGVSADTLIAGLIEVSERARTVFKKVFATTILPGGYTPEQNAERLKVNKWILEESYPWYDAAFDFAAALKSVEDEALLDPSYNSGDGIHPNDLGYEQMAAAVNITLLSGMGE